MKRLESAMMIQSMLCALAITFAAGTVAEARLGDPYKVAPVVDGGAIRGTIHFEGSVPAAKTLSTSHSEDKVCHTKPVPDESLVVSKDKGVQWAVVSIRSIDSGKAFPKKPPVLDQVGCRFIPHVVVVPVGAELRVLNNDGVLHNVHTKSLKNASLNRSMPAATTELAFKFKRKETISVTCDVHGWMKAWIAVAPHPYYTVTDASGNFALEDVPPGTYKVRVWHETLGKQDMEVVVSAGNTSKLDVKMKRK